MTAKIILSEAFANKEVGDVLELNPVLAASIVSRGVAKYYKAETVTTETTETTVIKTKKSKKNEKDT